MKKSKFSEAQISFALKQQHERLAFIGDVLNDFAVRGLVSRFIGYSGAFYRKKIAEQCEFYLAEPSLLPLLNLCLTPVELPTINNTIADYPVLDKRSPHK